MNPNTTHHIVDTATVNGKRIELRRLDTGDATAYVVVANGTYANFSNRAHAYAAFDMITESAYVR